MVAREIVHFLLLERAREKEIIAVIVAIDTITGFDADRCVTFEFEENLRRREENEVEKRFTAGAEDEQLSKGTAVDEPVIGEGHWQLEEDFASTIEIEWKGCDRERDQHVQDVERHLLFANKRRGNLVGDQTAAKTNVQEKFKDET